MEQEKVAVDIYYVFRTNYKKNLRSKVTEKVIKIKRCRGFVILIKLFINDNNVCA